MPLPTIVGIGAMKAGTSALHRYLDAHPDIAMADAKEVNFFFGGEPSDVDESWSAAGNWWRGVDWYRAQFVDDGRVTGEVSPGYTSPDHPDVAGRMAATVPDARLLYLVREPLARAVSQFRHHAREGGERRPVGEALLDPDSQYVARSRYHERVRPFLEAFGREQLLVVATEDLEEDRRAALARIHEHVGVEPWWDDRLDRRWHVASGPAPDVPEGVADEFRARVADDVSRLRELGVRARTAWLA